MEQKLKQILGDYAFTLAVLQHQLEEANQKIKELEKSKKETK